jgi:hypothetical protein
MIYILIIKSILNIILFYYIIMSFTDFINDLIGPSQKYCFIFQIFTIVYLLGILMYLGSFISLMYKGKLKYDNAIGLLITLTVTLLGYQASRLIYGMCLNSN